MFIRTQNKEILTKFDKVYIEDDSVIVSYFNDEIRAGKYKDLEECKLIVNAIHVCILAHTLIYQMPLIGQ